MHAQAQIIVPPTQRSTTVCGRCGGKGWVEEDVPSSSGTVVYRCWLCNPSKKGPMRLVLESATDPVNDANYPSCCIVNPW